MFLQLLIPSLILVGLAFIGLAFNILFRKKGKFPETGVGHNPEMKKRGLSCARSDEIHQFQLNRKIQATKQEGLDLTAEITGGCAGCSCE